MSLTSKFQGISHKTLLCPNICDANINGSIVHHLDQAEATVRRCVASGPWVFHGCLNWFILWLSPDPRHRSGTDMLRPDGCLHMLPPMLPPLMVFNLRWVTKGLQPVTSRISVSPRDIVWNQFIRLGGLIVAYGLVIPPQPKSLRLFWTP